METYESVDVSADEGHSRFVLRPVDARQDTALLRGWLNEPHVRASYFLSGFERDPDGAYTAEQVHEYLTRLHGDDHSRALIGLLDDVPVSYWEFYEVRGLPHLRKVAPPDSWGMHALVGEGSHVGDGHGSALIDAAARALERHEGERPIISDPRLDNMRARRAFEKAGFSPRGEISHGEKHSVLMVREPGASPTAF